MMQNPKRSYQITVLIKLRNCVVQKNVKNDKKYGKLFEYFGK